MVKDGCGQPSHKNWLYLKNELMEWTDFLRAVANSGKLKVISMIFDWMSKLCMAI